MTASHEMPVNIDIAASHKARSSRVDPSEPRVRENGNWWKEQLKHFNEVVYPNYKENGSAENANEFLIDI